MLLIWSFVEDVSFFVVFSSVSMKLEVKDVVV